MKFTKNELNQLAILKDLPEQLLIWIGENCDRIELNAGEHMFTHGQAANYLFIVVTGTIHRYHDFGGQLQVVATTRSGQVTGMLPYSRMTEYPGHAIAAEPSIVIRINKCDFNSILLVSHEFGQRLVAEMSNRVRADVRLEQQREKMASLGRLSAGLAHELNNPAAAIRSTSASLTKRNTDHNSFILELSRRGIEEKAIDAIEQLLNIVKEKTDSDLSPLQKSEWEEEISDWLGHRGVEESWMISSILTSAGVKLGDLDRFADLISDVLLPDVLTWVAGSIEIDQKVSEINHAAAHISELVSSIKRYSHMDQSPEHKPTDVHEGLETTLQIFAHKLKQNNIHVSRNFDRKLPAIFGNAGELNQIWTCLIDNAIDAMEDNGNLCIETSDNGRGIDVSIIDDGPGIPDNIRHFIFDPFFTTKGVGEGTGLGLDIARRIVHTHLGQIEVQSKPGRTEMLVRLPIPPTKI